MDDLPSFVTCPQAVRAVDFGHVLVLIDYRTGNVQALQPPAADQWNALSRTGVLDRNRIAPALGRRLLALGLLAPASGPGTWTSALTASSAKASWGSTEHPAGVVQPPHGPLAETLSAAAALTVAFAATRRQSTGMQRTLTLLSAADARTVRAATLREATYAVTAVRRAGWYSPGRTACLEESVAAVLLLASRRLGVRWCHGIASDPIRLHAWVQTMTGDDVAEPFLTRAYTPVLTIGDRHHQPR
ncbi:transglutaminase superfamily protein [Streptomyces sp. KhCrAH-43]|uniref:lasso peptide biosynthesis B2 protein n=1 Tax=unclassified Streptomyces TaxID=2593676 RepID=UPI00036D4321|nr:lasso peptide biosynthesis B2 protein [Streptomyces sp. KhCrAH-43]MYS33582.1 lasso peptide biosynthesis B2 protein [Streptomyces sp. SID4920]MYX63825.1 lasso peptide biosynthesis B2 protein [Streptomyces sp. SID8373]RAJ52823.1 transglutaminase superfamily protein [Streptomyces sp. KhCrAH-43]